MAAASIRKINPLSKDTQNGSTSGANEMRGLNQYIADLRACRVRDLEERRVNKEMAHIRAKFKEGNLDGYQKRKYLSKLVFTYILGYQVDIGHMEAINLISSTKYSEKQIGYLATTLLMHENSDIIRLVINSIRKDLADLNEVNNCLALQAIANVGSAEMADSLAEDVHRLLISPTSAPVVKKKAALTLLRLYRKHPEAIPADEWALRLVSNMDNADLGVALSVTNLVLTMAQSHLDAFAVCYQKAVHRLSKIVIDHEFSSDYAYYKVPIPWLQIKLLRLLQYYPPSEDPTIQLMLNNVLQAILQNSQEKPSNVQHSNALNAVLFEAINLAIHLDPESPMVASATNLLGRFILSKETNVRYLGLDTMTHLAARSESLREVKKHQDTVLLSLRDRDVSVRRRGLDLLYSMCDSSNAKLIVSELLKYLNSADFTLREELVLKIAILTEKFASEYEWYVNTIFKLMSQAGDHVGDEVWYRVIQIVTNTEQLQEYAAKKVYSYVKAPTAHESLVKVAAYILGEFGHLVANEPGLSPLEQFTTLHSKSNLCAPPTRALLLTTYLKWLNLFPEIREQLLSVLQSYQYVLDAELQQRACEYLAIAEQPTEDLLQIVCDEMPPFPERESALLSRMVKKHSDASDRRTWHAGGRELNKDKDKDRYKGLSRRKEVPTTLVSADQPDVASPPAIEVNNAAPAPLVDLMGDDDVMGSLAGLDLSSPSPSAQASLDVNQPMLSSDIASPSILDAASLVQSPVEEKQPMLKPVATPTPGPTTPVRPRSSTLSAELTHGSDKSIERLFYVPEGVLYEDASIQIGIKTEYHGHLGRVALYFGNKLAADFSSLTVTVESMDPDALSVTMPSLAPSTLRGQTQLQQIVQIECKNYFSEMPILRISYLAGSLQTYAFQLPVVLTKFVEPVTFNANDFFERWKQIGGPPLEAQSVFPIKLDPQGQIDVRKNRRVVSGFKMGLLDGVDPNPSNLVAAGVLHMSTAGKVGCLMRLEPNGQARLARLTVRSTSADVSKRVLDLLSKPLTFKPTTT